MKVWRGSDRREAPLRPVRAERFARLCGSRRVRSAVPRGVASRFYGSSKAKRELEAFETIYISLVSWMEILVGAAEGDEESQIREFLRRFRVHPVDEGVAERAVEIRRKNKIRLPDAIIWATAQQLGTLLVTRNTRDFPRNDPGVRIPYSI